MITQYVSGRLSFGAVVAVLTATMGDAAFLLLAAKPTTGLAIIVIGFFCWPCVRVGSRCPSWQRLYAPRYLLEHRSANYAQ